MAKEKNYTRRQVVSTIAATVASTAVATAMTEAAGADSVQQVQAARVVGYSFGWNAGRRSGIVYLYLENGSQPATINVASPDEFAGYLAILKEQQAFFDSNGWLYTSTQRPR